MSIIYVPANRNSFWSQVNNGTGLYGLVMQQLVKGLFNGIDKRHEAYIDKQVQDRNAAQFNDAWQYMKNNRGTHDETTYKRMTPEQYVPQDRLSAAALTPSDYHTSLNPNVYDMNRNKQALQNDLNQPMAGFADKWNNTEGLGINTKTVENPLTHSLFMDAVTNAKMSPEMTAKLYAVLQKEIENNADFASRQRTAQAVQAMSEPQNTIDLAALGAITGKDFTQAWQAMHPQMKTQGFNAVDKYGIAITDPRTGQTTYNYSAPYGISAEAKLKDNTERYKHDTVPAGTAYIQAQTNQRAERAIEKGLTPNQQIQGVYAGGQIAQMFGDDAEGMENFIQTFSPTLQPYIRAGATGNKVYDKGRKRYVPNPTIPKDGTTPQPKGTGWTQPGLSPQAQAAVAKAKAKYGDNVKGMSDAEIAKQLGY